FATKTHAVLPVAIERRNRALARVQGVRPLAEARPAPRTADFAADRSKHGCNGFTIQPRIRALDLLRDAARSGKNHQGLRGLRPSLLSRAADDERRREQIVVAAVGARP